MARISSVGLLETRPRDHVDQANPLPAPDVIEPPVPQKRIPTIEWMSREMKDEVEKAVQNGQECRLCNFQTSRRRIRIRVRQHMCMHYCHCGYQHVSRDQIAEHQKLTRCHGHARSSCKIYMVSSDQFPAFRKIMGWSASTTFGPSLLTTKKTSSIAVKPRPSTPSGTLRKTAKATAVCSQPIPPGYKIARRPQASPAPDTSSQPPELPVSPPASLRAGVPKHF